MAISFAQKAVAATAAMTISIWHKAVVAAVAMAILVLEEDEWLECAGALGRAEVVASGYL